MVLQSLEQKKERENEKEKERRKKDLACFWLLNRELKRFYIGLPY